MSHKNPEKRRAYLRAWKFKNRTKFLKKKRAYYHATKILHPRPLKTIIELKDKKRKTDKKYRDKNKAILKIKKARYFQINKAKINQKYISKLKNNVQAKIAHQLRVRIRGIVHRGSPVKDLGCSTSSFKKYIESKFKPGMTWENWTRNGWHLDHKIPLCRFDLTKRKEFKRAVHFTNLQPLWALENLIKNKY